MAASSNAVDVSTRTEDLKYIQALSVNVSNFVSLKLCSSSNYHTWKNEMLSLIRSHELLHIIHDKARLPWDEGVDPMTQKYDSLVRGWILNTMNDQVLHDFQIYRSVQLMWSNLESTFTNPPETIDGEGVSSNETRELKYMEASNFNVSEFVSVKLSGHSNYDTWKAQMLHLIESQDLLCVMHVKGFLTPNKYGDLVIRWIFGTMNEQLHKDFIEYNSAEKLWSKLESHFRDGDSWYEPVVSATTQDLKYMQASSVNVSNFVSVKLSGKTNYEIWKTQILNLLKSQGLQHILYVKGRYTVEKYETLVIGWILSTMNEQVLNDFTYIGRCMDDPDDPYYFGAKHVWNEIQSAFDPSKNDRKDYTSPGFEFIEDFATVPELENTDNIRIKKELYEAAVEGCWWKAKAILKNHRKAATVAITTANGNTILHIGVEMGNNYFVERLLEFYDDGKDIETQNSKGQTALHIAAIVGNTQAFQLLVQKREELLNIKDHNEKSPFDNASTNTLFNISAYLLVITPPSDSGPHSDGYQASAILGAIFTKDYDLAMELLKKNRHIASYDGRVLIALTITFPPDLGFTESFIYPSFHNVCVTHSLLFEPNFLDKCVDGILQKVNVYNNTCYGWLGKNSMILLVPIATLYPICQLIRLLIFLLRLTFSKLYFLLWKVLAVHVRPITNIEKKKKNYQKAKEVLSLICEQMGTFNEEFKFSLFEAVRQGLYEVVDEILFTSPTTINYKDDDGYNIIQLAIINRSEKVYNLIRHIIKRTESYRTMTDSSENNLVHLSGRLAPSFVLDRTTGAALQLQRELFWHEEVKQLFSPFELRGENKYKESPAMLFTKEHRDLMNRGENWIKTTAESCSITAALIVTIVFASAITVPGGSNESGTPLFKKEIAFTIFAVLNAISLFTATTALLLFLSILTTRFSEKDFLLRLPRTLIFGLFMLFLSTTTMILAFCAILFLVFCEERQWMLAPIIGLACLPISVIVAIKLPLLFAFTQSTYFSIFGKQNYLESCKVNQKKTVFTV